MAIRTSGTRSAEDPRLTDAQLALLAAQTGHTQAQIEALGEESAQGREKLRIAAQQLAQEGELGRGKLTQEGEKTAAEERASRLTAAMVALGLSQKAQATTTESKADMFKELIRRPDITPDVLAS